MINKIIYIIAALLTAMSACAEDTGRNRIYNAFNAMSSKQLIDRGYDFLARGDRADSALMCYTVVANRYYDGDRSPVETDNAVIAMENMGNIYMTRFFDYRRAYEYLTIARRLAEGQSNAPGNNRHLAYIYLSICNVWKMSALTSGKQRNQYVATLRKAFSCAAASGDAAIAATALVALCDEAVYAGHGIGIEKEAEIYRRMKKPKGAQLVAYTTRFARAAQLARQCRYDDAAHEFASSADMADADIANDRYRYISLTNSAYMMFMAGRQTEAADSLKQLLSRATLRHDIDYTVSITALLHRIYRQMGQTALADKYRLQYLIAKDSLAYRNNLSEISDVETSAKLGEANREMARLAHRHRVQNITTAAVGAVALILLVAIIAVARAYRQLRFSNRMLYRKNEQLMQRESGKEKYRGSRLDAIHKQELMRRIKDVLESNAEIFDSGFCLSRMAELVEAGYKEVSQVVNEEYGGNFNAMLNDYRLREACHRLGDAETYGNLTIEAIAMSVGFKSRTGFASLFKRYTGMTPSVYQKMAAEERRQSGGAQG